MKPDDIISYHQIVHAEKAALQKGMNYDLGKGYSVFLMSDRISRGQLSGSRPGCLSTGRA
jgi:hypothetical protein